ncbi:phosphoenolpyruvate carboxykinase (ATP) [Sulfidibacter corallicola]|uniref:Phosphoenolpyruvate carboxykinase (ATP) n=1 Tax=Sulfidibacter corallicola TaxID=2818388 RepID=A0A8A4TGX2_SULCO|nr:phosphoenolpyruvate carboxykinase (ATP) [Sulfidibacter corallicola]QTD48767.1 phosphoenolpyruvate carboxykinase (ATP) [Sulfidibacter corallicola]
MSETYGLDQLGLNPAEVHRNLPVEKLVEHTVINQEGVMGMQGATMCKTGKFTGRSPKDKYIVDEGEASQNVWWGPVNQKISEEVFDKLLAKVQGHYDGQDCYVFDGHCGASERFSLPIRIVTRKAWHAHFVNNMFIRPNREQLANHKPEFTIINACDITAEDYAELGLRSEVFVVFHLSRGLALIGGTMYAGEMKKGIFSVMNYRLPLAGTMSMHCSANMGDDGDTALFFGLSGTGKTTLSADPNRHLIGDDEHGWSDDGIFNFEGGCYAKCIDLSEEKEPDIWRAIRFGALLENVVYDQESRQVDFKNSSVTENTRVSYPIHHIDNAVEPSLGGHPKTIIFLTCDAFGVLPPVAKLTPGQAMYHFISGYTAKVAGTERGVTEPQATFSSCFGEPFLPLHPTRYAALLGEKMEKHGAKAYLVNTGWTGGAYGTGHRIDLPQTRAIITAILTGSIEDVACTTDKYYGFEVPTELSGVDSGLLNPVKTWEDEEKFHATARKLVQLFQKNFDKFDGTSHEYAQFGPKLD